MTVEGISDTFESTNFQDFPYTIWNGKEVTTLPTKPDAWLVLKIPFNSESSVPSLREKVSSAHPTVEEVLARHNLTFASTKLGQREVKELKTTDYGWLIIPLLSSTAPSLEGKVDIDANDYRLIEQVLERNGFWFSPSERSDPLFTMTTWV